MSKQIDETNRSFWALDYDNVIKECEEYCEKTDKDPLIILKNTFLRYTQLKALNMLNRNDEMAAVLFGKEKPMFLTSDWSLMIAQSYYMAGDVKDTIIFLQKAAKDAPEWDDPKQALQTITAQGIHP